MFAQSNSVGVQQWNEISKASPIYAYVPSEFREDVTEVRSSQESINATIRPGVIDLAQRLLREHREVWAELSKY